MAAGRSDLQTISGQLTSPVGGGDGGASSHALESGLGSSGVVVPLRALLHGVDHDGALAGVSRSGDDGEHLQSALAAVVVHGVELLGQHKAVVYETTLDEPARDPRRILMNTILLHLLGAGSRDGMSDEEGSASGETAGGDLHDLAAIDLADDALQNHLLGVLKS